MPKAKSNFVEKVLGRLGRIDQQGLQSVVQRLARERAFLETLFNTIEDGILVVDEEGKIVYSNLAAGHLFGFAPESVENQPVRRHLPELDWLRLESLDKEGGPRIFRHEFEIHYPRPRFLRLYAAPLDGESVGRAGFALIVHDATEARQQTFEAIESERVQALTLLAASVAHEVGNPLNALSIHLQLMDRELKKLRWTEARCAKKKTPAPPAALPSKPLEGRDVEEISDKLAGYLAVAKGEIARLDDIVTQFLQAIRPSRPQWRPASLNDVAAETLALLRPQCDNRGLLVEQRFQKPFPDAVIDPRQIKQVLVNLAKNAMQAMTRGGRLGMETGSTPDGVWIAVSDTGGGIPTDQLQRIFEPFFTTKKKGSGLGLMIVQRIVRDHGGRIEVESHMGKGTSFRVWLPRGQKAPRLLEAGTP
ncbi:MAG: PAS domain S-box protein [Verrucomicrobia bacterium]|nr:PAS domain S-box protein [Verrucomicrobiota bacterium]